MAEAYALHEGAFGTAIVLESRASTTRKGVELVKHRWEAVNQRGELVLIMEGWGMFGRKD